MSRLLFVIFGIACASIAPARAQWSTQLTPWPAQPERTFSIDTQVFAVLDADAPTGRALFANSNWVTAPGFYRSIDEGRTWEPVPLSPGAVRSAVLWAGTLPDPAGFPSRRGELYVTEAIGGAGGFGNAACRLSKSGDLGQSWVVVADNIGACTIAIDPSNVQTIYGLSVGYAAMFRPEIHRSLDGGRTWARIGTNLRTAVNRIRVAADGTLYAIGDSIYVSSDQGATWTAAAGFRNAFDNPYGGDAIYDVLPVRHPAYGDDYAVAATSAGVFVSTDGGKSWSLAGLPDAVTFSLDAIEPAAGALADVRVGFRGGLALLRGTTVLPLQNGLATGDTFVKPVAERYALSAAGLSRCANVDGCIGGTLPQMAVLVEYHNALLDHYFMTSDAAEAAGIDAGAAGPGWSRTGLSHVVHASTMGTEGFVNPVCRFYGRPGVGPNSHFFSAERAECAGVLNDSGWQLETNMAFAATSHDACGQRLPLYRLYNNRFAFNDSNHRYVSDPALYASMQARGWTGEGIRLCVEQ